MYSIYDSNIYQFVYDQKPHQYRVNNLETYVDYMESVHLLIEKPQFLESIHIPINETITAYTIENGFEPYQVGKVRCAAIIMFISRSDKDKL